MRSSRSNKISRIMLSGLVLIALLAFSSSSAFASTSADATIFNQVTVSYASGTDTLTATADISVTVITLATAPTIDVDKTTDTASAGGVVTYTYTARSNANGEDIYTLTTPVTSADANVTAANNVHSTSTITLWGGIVLSSTGETISLPGGSVVNLTGGETVELTVGANPERYTVAITNAGAPESDGVPEVLAVLTLTAVGGSPSISGSVVAGTQIGEYQGFTIVQTVGTPSTPGTDGTHTTNLTFTTTATDAGGAVVTYTTVAGDSNETVTTVVAPAATITKASRNASVVPADVFVTDGSTTAKPGDVIEYRIVVTNSHTTAAVSSVYISDALPTYTAVNGSVYVGNDVQIDTYVNSTSSKITTYGTFAADNDVVEVVGTDLVVTLGGSAGDAGTTPPEGGALAALDSATVFFQVKVQ